MEFKKIDRAKLVGQIKDALTQILPDDTVPRLSTRFNEIIVPSFSSLYRLKKVAVAILQHLGFEVYAPKEEVFDLAAVDDDHDSYASLYLSSDQQGDGFITVDCDNDEVSKEPWFQQTETIHEHYIPMGALNLRKSLTEAMSVDDVVAKAGTTYDEAVQALMWYNVDTEEEAKETLTIYYPAALAKIVNAYREFCAANS